MKKTILAFIFLLTTAVSYAGWVNLNTGINDNLTGVVFWGSKGLVTGSHGIYYTTNGGSGAASWTRFNISTNHNDSVLYNRTKFRHAYADPVYGSNRALVCGIDTVDNKSVIMLITFAAFTHTVVYTGPINSGGFNKIAFAGDFHYYIAGDNGQLTKVYYTAATPTVIVTPYTDDFNSIDFNSTQFCMVANGNMVYGTQTSSAYTYTAVPSPGNNFKDVYCISSNASYAVGNDFYKLNFNGVTTMNDYDFGPLKASGFFFDNNVFYIGTDHGIFKSNTGVTFLEWQPSSLNYNISAIWRASSATDMYACGANGVVLKSSDYGGLTKPFATINSAGGCAGANTIVNAITGSSTNCKWYINNALVASYCNSLSYTFPSAGQYTLQVNTSNGVGLYDTAVQVITIVNSPVINKPVSISKSVLCRQEAIVLTVGNSEPNVFYTLKKIGTGLSYGSSGAGNTSSLNFSSSVLSTSGNYYLEAGSTMATCTKEFTDTIKIEVENTKAEYHIGMINANPNEIVTCFEQCTDAQNFKWAFSPNATASNTTASTPTVSFSTPGQTQVKLVAWSNHGCYDSIQGRGPTIYIEPSVIDSCWTRTNIGIEPFWNTSSFIFDQDFGDIAQLSPSRSGFITCGFYRSEAFLSNYGDSLRLPAGQGGAYLAKYNLNGALKWINYSDQVFSTSTQYRESIFSAVEDKQGNIYACGRSANFKDNTGEVFNNFIFHPNYVYVYTNSIYKMDSTGKVIWRVNFTNYDPLKIFVDNAGDVYLMTKSPYNTNGINTAFTLNGTTTYSHTNVQMPQTNFQILKFSSAGNFLWVNGYNIVHTNPIGLMNISFDKYNNVYVTGFFGQSINLYTSPGSTLYQSYNPGGTDNRLFFAKYNSAGTLQWKMKSSDDCFPLSSNTDSIGNTYICGSKGFNVLFENTNGTMTTASPGAYFVAKINSSGICKWVQSALLQGFDRAYEVYQEGNELSVLGQTTSNPVGIVTNTFTSADNNMIMLSIGPQNYFVAVYDTLGNIKKVIQNANNPALINGLDYGFAGFYKKNGQYHLANNFYSNDPYINFGDIVPRTYGTDGMVSAFTEGCGIVTTSSAVSCTSPTLTVSGASICAGSTTTLTASGAPNYSWSPAATLSSATGTAVIANPTTTTIYYITGGTGPCMSMTTTNVQIIPTPTLSVLSVSVCAGFLATLTASGVSTYTWSNPTSNSHTISVTPSATTIYTVSGSTQGCVGTYSATGTVSVIPTPTISITAVPACMGKPASLTASGASSYYWTPPGVATSVLTLTTSGVSYQYTVNGTTAGCSRSVYAPEPLIAGPVISITASATDICSGQSVTLTASGANTYTWTSAVNNGVGFVPLSTQVYSITGTALTTCTNMATQLVTVHNCTGIEENINVDGISIYPNPANEMVFINGLTEQALDVQLINQLGQKVYCKYSDGSISLNGLAEGMYYLLIYKDHALYYQAKLFKE